MNARIPLFVAVASILACGLVSTPVISRAADATAPTNTAIGTDAVATPMPPGKIRFAGVRSSAYGIQVFLQVEPGYADVDTLIDLVLSRYKHHPGVIGWGIDVEWYQNAKTGSPNAIATDAVAKAWEARVKAHNPKYRLLVKHFRVNNLPETYRGDLLFCCNSQMYDSADAFVASYKRFADRFYPSTVVFQIGYPRDKTWWGLLEAPVPKTLGEKLAAEIRQEIGLAWVDFGMRDVLPAD